MLNENKYFTTSCSYFVVSLGQQPHLCIFEDCMQVNGNTCTPFWFPWKRTRFLVQIRKHERNNGICGFLQTFIQVFTQCGCCFVWYKEWVNSTLISLSHICSVSVSSSGPFSTVETNRVTVSQTIHNFFRVTISYDATQTYSIQSKAINMILIIDNK